VFGCDSEFTGDLAYTDDRMQIVGVLQQLENASFVQLYMSQVSVSMDNRPHSQLSCFQQTSQKLLK